MFNLKWKYRPLPLISGPSTEIPLIHSTYSDVNNKICSYVCEEIRNSHFLFFSLDHKLNNNNLNCNNKFYITCNINFSKVILKYWYHKTNEWWMRIWFGIFKYVCLFFCYVLFHFAHIIYFYEIEKLFQC